MKKVSIILGILLFLCVAVLPMETQAATEGYLTYTIENGEVTITDCDEDASGKIAIPDTIEGYPVTKIGEYAFHECTGIKEIVVPEGITVIPTAAFADCETLAKVTLPKGLTSIEKSAFSGCEGLTTIHIPKSVTSIGGWAFQFCRKLSAITLPEGLQEINENTFAYCNSLKDITIPESVTTIGERAFLGCALPEGFVIPKNVSSIGDGAFLGCSNISKFVVDEVNGYFSFDERGVLFNADKTRLIQAPRSLEGKYEVPAGVQIIQGYAFAGCSAMTEIVFPNTVTKIGPHALSSIGAASVRLPEGLTVIESGLLITCKNLVSVYIPDSVTRIQSEAFKACYELRNIRLSNNLQYIGEWAFDSVYMESIHLPKSLKEVARGAFSICSSLTNVYFYGTQAQWQSIKFGEHNQELLDATLIIQSTIPATPKEGYLSYSIENGEATITDCDPEATGVIVIPDTIKGYPVTAIGYNAFSYVMNITKVVLPAKLKTIEDGAFGYTGIESIIIPDSVTYMSSGVFWGCWKLTDVVIGSGITAIPHSAFRRCTKLETITIPDGITTINSQAFYECYALKRIKLPAALQELGRSAFRECESLTSIVIPDGVTIIPAAAFNRCSSLTEVVLPKGLTTIGNTAFSHCQFKEINIPDTVTSIGEYAFAHCSALTKVTYGGDQTQWNAIDIKSENDELVNAERTYHVWDEGTVRQEPTCAQNGEKVFQCQDCHEEKSKVIPMLTTHSYGEEWSSDGSEHWHECTVCKERADVADHIPGPAATVNAAQLCSVCGYELAPKLGVWQSPVLWIIVGAVVLLAGGAVAIVVWKKKRK